MEAIKKAFEASKTQQRVALITYVTAGFPTVTDTPSIMLAMQAGGAGTHSKLIRRSKQLIIID